MVQREQERLATEYTNGDVNYPKPVIYRWRAVSTFKSPLGWQLIVFIIGMGSFYPYCDVITA